MDFSPPPLPLPEKTYRVLSRRIVKKGKTATGARARGGNHRDGIPTKLAPIRRFCLPLNYFCTRLRGSPCLAAKL